MQYLNKTFTLPTTTKPMTREEYEVAVGLRKPITPHCMGTAFPVRPRKQCRSCKRTDHPLADNGMCWECWGQVPTGRKVPELLAGLGYQEQDVIDLLKILLPPPPKASRRKKKQNAKSHS